MNTPNIVTYAQWQWIAWSLLAVVGAAGLLAVAGPRLFSRLVTFGGRWVDTDRYLVKLNRRVAVDSQVLRHCRLLGLASIAATLVLAFFIRPLQFDGQWLAWTLLAAVGATGLLALFSPRGFARLAAFASIWVDSDKFFKKFDRRVDVDGPVLRHCRLFGVVALVAAVVVAVSLI